MKELKKEKTINMLPTVDRIYLENFLIGLLNTPSPTGFAYRAVDYTEKALAAIPGLLLSKTRKGALIAKFPGKSSEHPRALTAHVDTLGAMVKEIKPNGRLKLTRIGGILWNSVETEGCTVFTNQGETIRGSLLAVKASGHVFGSQAIGDLKREDATMEVRLDARTSSPAETEALGIQVGDFVAFDPRVEMNNGFIRSRHLDDKACAACAVTAFKAMVEEGLQPAQDVYLHISNYEEVGHSPADGLPANLAELVVVDMAAVGEGQTSDEFHTTLCVKDSGGPYHHGLSQKLREVAKQYDIPFKVDIYPSYNSDGGALFHESDVAVALIGPGIDASHNYERTHIDALLATTRWVMAYLIR
jgi:putative aminopeptidase FrvX